MEASQSTPAQPDAPAEAQQDDSGVITPAPPQEQAQAPDLAQISKQINTLQERFDAQSGQQQEAKPAGDIWDELGAEPGDGEQQPAEGEQQDPVEDWLGQNDFGQQQAPMFNSQEEFDAYVQQKADERILPHLQEQQTDARRDKLSALQKQYPDIGDYVDAIRPSLVDLAERSGQDPNHPLSLAFDPALVEAFYKGVKADEASTAEVDAKDASNAGASLETGTGPGSQGSEQDPGEAFANVFSEMARASSQDAFS